MSNGLNSPAPHSLADALREQADECLRLAELEKLPDRRKGLKSLARSYAKLSDAVLIKIRQDPFFAEGGKSAPRKKKSRPWPGGDLKRA